MSEPEPAPSQHQPGPELDASTEPEVEVAHEALIRHWRRLRGWLTEDQVDIRLREDVADAARAWDEREQLPDYLVHRGALLNEVEALRSVGRLPLNDLEARYVVACVDLRDRNQREEHERKERELQSARRHTRVAVSLATLAFLAFVVALFAAISAIRARNEAQHSEATAIAEANGRATAEASAQQQLKLARSRELAAQSDALENTDLGLAVLLSLEGVGEADTIEARGQLYDGLLDEPQLHTFLTGHRDGINGLAFGLRGRALASASSDGSIILWDVGNGTQKGRTPPVTSDDEQAIVPITSVGFDVDSHLLVSGSANGVLAAWSISDAFEIREAWSFPPDANVPTQFRAINGLAFTQDGRLMASCRADGSIQLWDVTDPVHPAKIGDPLRSDGGEVTSVAFSPNASLLAAGNGNGTVAFWEMTEPRHPMAKPMAPIGHQGKVWSVAFSPDGQTLASGGDDGAIILWDLTVPDYAQIVLDTKEQVYAVAFYADGRTLAEGSADRRIHLWDLESRTELRLPLLGHGRNVRVLALSPDGKTLASGGADARVILWDSMPAGLVDQQKNQVKSVAFDPTGELLAAGSSDGYVSVWKVTSGEKIAHLPSGSNTNIRRVAFSPDGSLLAAATEAGSTVVLWDAHDLGQPGIPINVPTGVYTLCVAFSPDSKTLGVCGWDGTTGTIRLWNIEDWTNPVAIGEPVIDQRAATDALAFSPNASPNGPMLVSGGWDRNVRVYGITDLAHPQLVNTLTGHGREVTDVEFSPHGTRLASASGDFSILLWDVDDLVLDGSPTPVVLVGHPNGVLTIAFKPDDTILASGGWDEQIRFWDVSADESFGFSIEWQTDPINEVAFDQSGRFLASASDDGTVMLWDTDIGLENAQDRACQRANRNLSQSEWSHYFPGEPYRRTFPNLPDGEGAKQGEPATPGTTPVAAMLSLTAEHRLPFA
jgi:WD40 repeat protein